LIIQLKKDLTWQHDNPDIMYQDHVEPYMGTHANSVVSCTTPVDTYCRNTIIMLIT